MLSRRRKFAIAGAALVMSFILALVGVVEGPQWVQVTGLIVGLYGGAEAAEGFAHARGNSDG